MNKEIACKMEKYFLQEFYEKFPGSATAGTAEHFQSLMGELYESCDES